MVTPHRTSRRAPDRRASAAVTAVTAVTLLLITLAGCGDDPEPGGSNDPIAVTIEGDKVTPQGDRVQITKGSPVSLEVTSDTAGVLHVHTTEEQSFDFEVGSTDIELNLDQPGIVDVELHEPDVLVVQLEVR